MERLVTDMTETEILFDLLEKGISPAHAVSACEKRLTDAGFEVVDYGTAWNLKAGGKYVVNHHETTLFAFTLPQIGVTESLRSALQQHIQISHA